MPVVFNAATPASIIPGRFMEQEGTVWTLVRQCRIEGKNLRLGHVNGENETSASESFCCPLILRKFEVYGTTVNPEAFTYRTLTLAPPTKIRFSSYGTSHIHLTEFRFQRKSLHSHQTSFLESNSTQMSWLSLDDILISILGYSSALYLGITTGHLKFFVVSAWEILRNTAQYWMQAWIFTSTREVLNELNLFAVFQLPLLSTDNVRNSRLLPHSSTSRHGSRKS